jgi:hypothetical protein
VIVGGGGRAETWGSNGKAERRTFNVRRSRSMKGGGTLRCSRARCGRGLLGGLEEGGERQGRRGRQGRQGRQGERRCAKSGRSSSSLTEGGLDWTRRNQPGRLRPCASADGGVGARRDERAFGRRGLLRRLAGLRRWSSNAVRMQNRARRSTEDPLPNHSRRRSARVD